MATLEQNGHAGVLIFSEKADVARELLAIGRELADQSASRLTVLDVGQDLQARVADEIARGADEVLVLHAGPGPVGTEAHVEALYQGVQVRQPAIVLIGSTRAGVEVAARLAQRLGVACASECVAIQLDQTGDLVIERRVYGGRFIARQVMRSVPRIATVQLKRFEAPPRDEQRRGEVREIVVQLPPSRVKTIAVKERVRSQTDITKAEVIVAAGRGVKKREDLELLETLARLLGGEIAGSRPVTDDLQWLPDDRKIGLSGHTVKPRLYVACGVSGQIEHVVGMRSARTVVAINRDPKAPIHGEADYSIIGDLYEVVPALIKACQDAKDQRA